MQESTQIGIQDQMSGDLISIIVPIYNVEKYLKRCLDSIAAQSYTNFQVLLVNDGSKDRSRDIAESFTVKDCRFRLYDKENGGLSSARNYGLELAEGNFVCFVDSDDFLFPDYLSSLYNAFNEEDDIVIGDYVIFDDKQEKAYAHGKRNLDQRYTTIDEKKELVQGLLQGKLSVMPVWKNMYRLVFLKENNLRFVSERMVYAEDALFHVEAYSIARCIHIIPDIIFNHLVVYNSLSQSYRENYFLMHKELYSRIVSILEKHYEDDMVIEYKKQAPGTIGSCLFNLCKCEWNKAISNVKKVLNDDFTRHVYDQAYSRSGYLRYWILYLLGKTRKVCLIVLCAKLMCKLNPIYRKIQRKQPYRADKDKYKGMFS